MCLRVRPLNKQELDKCESVAVGKTNLKKDIQAGSEVVLDRTKGELAIKCNDGINKQSLRYHFSSLCIMKGNCFSSDTETHEIYETLVRRVVKSSFEGVNGKHFSFHYLIFLSKTNR